jgi:glucosylceramidase
VRTLKELKAQGIGVQYLTVANEPLLPPSETQLVMNMSWQEQDDLIKNHLGPALDAARAEVGAVELLAFDHNAKDFEFPLNILKDAGARKYVGGTAFHCYNGSAKLLESLKAAYPEKDLLLTECSMGLWLNGFMTTIEYISRDLIIKNFEAGSKSLLLWNLALDVHGGPTNQPQSNVRGVITVEKDLARDQIPKHQLLRYLDLEGKGQVAKEPEYYLFSHLSKILKPGARRIASTYIQPTLFLHEYLGRENSPDLESVAFENPDHSVGIFLLNGSMTGTLNFHVRTHDQCERLSMPPKSVMTLLLKP